MVMVVAKITCAKEMHAQTGKSCHTYQARLLIPGISIKML